MEIKARHIQALLLQAREDWDICVQVREGVRRGQSDILGLSEYLADMLNESRVVTENIAALKSTEVESQRIYKEGVAELKAEHESTVNYVDEAIAANVKACKHTMRSGPTCLSPIITCAICGCILDKEMCGE